MIAPTRVGSAIGNALPARGPDAITALGARPRGQRAHAADGAEERHGGGHAVRAEVEQGAGQVRVEEGRRRVPGLRRAGEEVDVGHGGLADHAALQRVAQRLMPRPEEGVGRRADEHAGVRGGRQHLARGVEARGERLLRVHVLARRDGLERHLGVPVRRGEAEDDVDVRARDQRVRRARLEPVLPRGALRGGGSTSAQATKRNESKREPFLR